MSRLLTATLVLALSTGLAPAPTGAAQAGAGRAAKLAELERNEALWSKRRPPSYRFRLRVVCFCPSRGRPLTITVRNGRATGAHGFERRMDTVPEMFARIRSALKDRSAGKVTVAYDRRRGFPRRAAIDPVRTAIDDEYGWTADRFRALR